MPYADPAIRRAFHRRYERDRRKRDPEWAAKADAATEAWRAQHKEERAEWVRKNARHRDATDIDFRLRTRLRNRTRWAIKCAGGIRACEKTETLLGCTIAELRANMEMQFQPGMSWANHGEWHIDHRRPCASFDLRDPAQQAICFHYTNLQPLWALDNIRKGARI